MRILLLAAALAVASPAADRSNVIIQGRALADSPPQRTWTLCLDGVPSAAGRGEAYQVPAGRALLVREVAFTVRGGGTSFARAGSFRLSARRGGVAFELAQLSAPLLAGLEACTVTRAFTPGLRLAPGTELRAEAAELKPGGPAQVDVTVYGFFTSAPGR